MKAFAIAGPGSQPSLLDLPIPQPADGEVLVRVRASSLNGFDVSVAHGYLHGMMEHRFPVVLGKDFAGTVEATGPGVDGLAAGLRSLRPEGVDAAVHLAGDGMGLAAACRPGGRLASTVGLTAEQVGRDDLTVTAVMANPATSTLDRLAAAVADGTVRVPIQRTYSLQGAPQAFADFEAGTLGKLAVTID